MPKGFTVCPAPEVEDRRGWLAEEWSPIEGEGVGTIDVFGHFFGIQFVGGFYWYWHRRPARKAGKKTIQKIIYKICQKRPGMGVYQPVNESGIDAISGRFNEGLQLVLGGRKSSMIAGI